MGAQELTFWIFLLVTLMISGLTLVIILFVVVEASLQNQQHFFRTRSLQEGQCEEMNPCTGDITNCTQEMVDTNQYGCKTVGVGNYTTAGTVCDSDSTFSKSCNAAGGQVSYIYTKEVEGKDVVGCCCTGGPQNNYSNCTSSDACYVTYCDVPSPSPSPGPNPTPTPNPSSVASHNSVSS